jgi:hypothetical protein
MPAGQGGGKLAGMARATPASAARMSKKRRIIVWTLVVLASVLALVSILTTWVNRQMLDNTAWNKATTQIIEDPQVQASIAAYTIDQVYGNVDVAQALQQRLPKNLQPLAAPLAGALEQPATRGVQALLQRPRFQRVFIQASAIAHQKLVAVLENKTSHGIQTGNGVVTLNLHQLVVDVATRLGLSSDAIAKLPDKAGTVTLLKSDQLSAAQSGVQAVRVLSAWLLVAVLFMYGLAIYLARGARRATLRNAGVGFALVGLLVLVLRHLLGNYITNSLASPGYEASTHRLWLIGTSILGQIGSATLLYGLIAAFGAVLAGPTVLATRVRRELAPTLNEHQGIVWGVLGFVYLLLLLWAPTHALRVWWGILLLAGLLALGVVALRRETLREFPPGATKEAPPEGRSASEEIARLSKLHESGALSDDEFEAAKKIALT